MEGGGETEAWRRASLAAATADAVVVVVAAVPPVIELRAFSLLSSVRRVVHS